LAHVCIVFSEIGYFLTQLSIVIPSYNCAQWLERSVRSTQYLGMEQPEVLIVDDGSTDDTPTLGPALAAAIPGVKYLRKPNGGLSSARNFGIERATGSYILLLDSDDELIPCNIGPALATGVDMLRIGMEEVVDGVAVRLHQEGNFEGTGQAYLKSRLGDKSFYTPSCAYLYRREWLVSSGIGFFPGLIHEDNLFTVQALVAAHQIIAVPEAVYRYIRREGSITLDRDESRLRRRIASLSTIIVELTRLSNNHKDVDLRWWIDETVHNAAVLARDCHGVSQRLRVFMAHIRFMLTYRGYGAPGLRYEQRLRFKQLLFGCRKEPSPMRDDNPEGIEGLVSIIVPAFNQERWIAETLDSICEQDYQNWECIVVNDGSTDTTAEIVERYVAFDSRFRLITQDNSGVSTARNRGLLASRGQYIQFLDGDDILLPEKLAMQVKDMEQTSSDVSICAVKMTWHKVDSAGVDGKILFPPAITELDDPFQSFLAHWEVDYVVPIQAFFLRAIPLRKNNLEFNPSLYSHEDWDFWLQLMACKPVVSATDSVLAIYRVHGDGVTANRYRCWKGYLQSLAIQRERYQHLPEADGILSLHYRRLHREYRASFPFRSLIIKTLVSRPWFRRVCPWSIQRPIREFCGS
jgi:glycosyltransferase involved in cell wall biosynthesis